MAHASAPTGTTMQQATTAADPLAETNIRRRRPDPLEYLVAEGLQSQTRLDNILEIVTHILWINAVVLRTLRDGYYGFPQIISRLDRDFETLITEEEASLADRVEDLYEPRIKSRIMTYLRNLTPNERMAFIIDGQPCQFYREALRVKVIKRATSSRAIATAESNPNLEKPEFYDWCETTQQYIGQLGVEMEESHYQLTVFLSVFKELLNSIQAAARLALLSQEELQALQIKLQAVADYYPVAYSAAHGASGSEQHLLNAASESWWETSTESRNSTPGPGTTVFTAYQASEIMRSSLNFIVPIVSLVSVVPAALAWKYGIVEKVTFTDPNFYQAITGSVLQLLSLVTFIWPTLSHPRLSRLNWVWIWILAGCSVLCALTSPLLYWFFSTTWSFVISFVGAIFQAVIQLQVINSI
ncbi:hypothetical protein BKA66DRAFT_478672 [Pyrenochaeta sp. MPI-SDFR-AT-0127]|nr:hypothetical protein BKA66DRAFT_478672 [Pyrenochaeta sp. MPI-SDFR-AT-0127]